VTAPEQLIIDTPEQVSLEFALAGVGSRFLAIAIDSVLQVAGLLLLVGAAIAAASLGRTGVAGIGTWGTAVLVLTGFVLYFGYFAAFESLWHGQTPGKRLIGLRVISVTGRPVSAYEAILRNLLRTVDQLPAVYAIGIVSVLLTRRNQRLGDLAAATVVVHERAAEDAPASFSRASSGARYGAGRLDGREVALIESFLSRRHELGDEARRHASGEIARRVRSRLGVADGAADHERFLEDVASEYRESGRFQ
jgi:uncharacterized RDD family membrane protein YckC